MIGQGRAYPRAKAFLRHIRRAVATTDDLLSPPREWTPSRFQFQTTECGVGSLAIILAHYGRDVPMEDIRTATGVSRDCLNAADVVAGARAFGLDVKVRTCEPERLAEFGFPAIIHLNFIHFVVVEGMSDTHILINDPHAGRRELALDAFDDSFTGIVLTFSPSGAFAADMASSQTSRLPWFDWLITRRDWGWIAAAAAAHVFATGALVMAIIAAVSGATLAAVCAAAVFFGARAARGYLLARLATNIADRMGRDMTAHLLRLNRAALAYRMPDRLSRVILSASGMARALSDELMPQWFAIIGAPVFLAAIMSVDIATGVYMAAATLVLAGLARALIPWRGGRGTGAAGGATPFVSLAGALSDPKSWKFGGGDRGVVVGAMSEHAQQCLDRLRLAAADFANNLFSFAITPGLLCVAILSLTTAPASDGLLADALIVLLLTIALGASLRKITGVRGRWRHLKRDLFDARDLIAAPTVADLSASPTDSTPDPDLAPQPEPGGDAPTLKMSNVTFGYSSRRPVLLNDVTVELGRGEHLGLTGPSGGGKSTIGRVLAGVVEPWSGEVEMFGAPLGPANRPVWIDKSTVFFEASLRDNLTLWDAAISDERIFDALTAACIIEEITRRPQGLDTEMEARGRNFSGGQLQRLEIARALLRNPRVLILDEAVDAMNPAIEAQVRRNLRDRGVSLIIISHRASTLAACDRVVTFVDGKIVDGVHSAPPPAVALNAAPAKAAIDRDHEDAADVPVQGLQDAFAEVCRAEGVTAPPRGTTLGELASSVSVMFRTVRLKSPDYWRCERPAMIGFEADDAAVGTRARAIGGAAPASAGSGIKEAIQVYDVDGADVFASAQAIVAAAFRAAGPDVARVVAIGLLTGLAVSLLPMAVAREAPASFVAALSGLFALGGMAVAHLALSLAAIRVANRVENGLIFAVVTRCRKIRMSALRHTPPHKIFNALTAISAVVSTSRSALPAAMISSGMIVGGVTIFTAMQVAANGATPVAVLFVACAAAALIPAGITALRLEIRRQDQSERRREARIFLYLADGLFRLRTLGRDQAAAVVAQNVRTDALEGQARLRNSQAVAGAVSHTAALLGLIAIFSLSQQAASAAVTAGAIALCGAVWLGETLASVVAQKPLFECLEEYLTLPLETGAETPDRTAALIADKVSFHHDGQPVLRDVSMSVAAGEVTVLAGASGSGKSTLLNLLLGIDQPIGGEVRYGAVPLDTLSGTDWRRRIGAVFQSDRLETASTIRGHLARAESISISAAWRLLDQVELVCDVSAMPMGMQTIADGGQISTGQQQRLLIARQLAAAPEILVLDEAMNAVPDDVQAKLIANFRKMGLTCLIVTHRASTIALADRVIVLERGRVVHDGPPGPALARADFQNDLTAEHMLPG